MFKMDQNNEVEDIIAAAQEYLCALKALENDVKLAEQQIENSARETEHNITSSFSNLLESLTSALQKRQNHLLQKTGTVRDKSLKPLKECRKIIQNKIRATEDLVSLGKKVGSKSNKHQHHDVNIDASFLGSLPEVPALNQVPFISYICEPNSCRELLDGCSSYGCVSTIAPVQISSLLEKPGSILVEWHCIESEDKLIDIQEFRLQKAYGNVLSDIHSLTNFTDCYLGSDNQYLVKDLQINQTYSFRVCCKFEGSSSWSPWSLPQAAQTSIRSYSWEENTKSFCLRNDNKIAKPVSSSKSVLFSEGPQFHVGYCIEFTFLECDPILKDMFVGITYKQNKKSIDSLVADSFLVEATGDVYISGVKKCTKLPEISVGSKISFTCTQLNDSKILMNVDSGEKRVTYDWTLSSDDVLYFFAIFTSSKWKVMVE